MLWIQAHTKSFLSGLAPTTPPSPLLHTPSVRIAHCLWYVDLGQHRELASANGKTARVKTKPRCPTEMAIAKMEVNSGVGVSPLETIREVLRAR